MWVYDRESLSFLDVNEAAVEHYGFSRLEFRGMTIDDLRPDKDLERLPGSARRKPPILRRSAECQHRLKDGGLIDVQTTSQALKYDGHKAVFVLAEDITERKRTEGSLQRRLDELAALQASLLEITTPRPLPDLLQTIVRRAASLLESRGGGLYLCDSQNRQVRCVVSYNTARDFTGTTLKYGEGAAGTVAQTGKPLIIDDYRVWRKRAAAFEKDQPFSAVLSVPITWDKQVTGVLHVLRDVQGQPFTEMDLSLLSMFAGHAAVAVKNAQLFEEAQLEIHERKNAEHGLRSSEQRLRALIEATSEGIVFHENGQIVDVNPAILAMFGFTSVSDAIGHSLMDFVAPESRDLVLRELKSAGTTPFEAFGRRADGSIFPVEIARRLYQRQGRPVRVAALRDISERKRTQDMLRESEEQYRGLVAEIGEGVFVADERGVLTSASPTLAGILGVPDAGQLLGRDLMDFVDPSVRARVIAHYRQSVQIGRTRDTTVVEIVRPDGSAATVEVRSVSITRAGEVVGTRGLVRDITETKRSADALAAAERRFRALVEKASDAIALLAPDGTLLYDSPAAPGLTGYEPGSLFGKNMLLLVHPDDLSQVQATLELLLHAPGLTINTLFRFKHRDGRWLWFEATGTNMLEEPSVQAIVLNYRDVTEREHIQEQTSPRRGALPSAFRLHARWLCAARDHLQLHWKARRLSLLGAQCGL